MLSATSVKDIKTNAKHLLYADWFSHIAILFGCAMCTLGIVFAGSATISLLQKYAHLTDIDFNLLTTFFALLTVFGAIPLSYGVCVYFYNVANGHKADVMDLFYAFGNTNAFRRSFCLFWALLWRFSLIFSIPSYLVQRSMTALYEDDFLYYFYGDFDIGYFLVSVYLFLLIFAAFSFFARYFAAIYLTVSNEYVPVSVCFSTAAFALSCHKGKHSFARLIWSYFILIVVSVLTVGILLILYTVPLMLIACFFNAAKLLESDEIRLYYNALLNDPPDRDSGISQ